MGNHSTKNSRHDAGVMTVFVQSKDGGDEALLTITTDELYAMVLTDQGMPKAIVFPVYSTCT